MCVPVDDYVFLLQVLVEETGQLLDSLNGVSVVHAQFYELSSSYNKVYAIFWCMLIRLPHSQWLLLTRSSLVYYEHIIPAQPHNCTLRALSGETWLFIQGCAFVLQYRSLST